MTHWYEVVPATEGLIQGDILLKCPVFFPNPTIKYNELTNPAEIDVRIDERDVIVLTQSCDLQNCKPDRNIVLCPLVDFTSIPQNILSNLVADKMPRFHLLNQYNEDGKPPLDFQVIDFGTIYTIPFGVLNNWKETVGDRHRLLSPHRELMAQRFGMQFLRIGYDDQQKAKLSELTEFWKVRNAEFNKVTEGAKV